MRKRVKYLGHCRPTDTYRSVGCRPIGLSPIWLASRYFHKWKIGCISDM